MGRHKEPVRYKMIGRYWYYKTPDMDGFKTTGETTKALAKHVVTKLMQRKVAGNPNPLFNNYAEPFFDWERCPHVLRLKAEGKHIGERYCHSERVLLEQYVFPSSLGKMHIADIRRGDLLDYRARLQAKGVSGNTINKIMKAVKVIFSEAVYREDLPYNPALGLGNVVTNNKEAGIFSELELRALFRNPYDSLLWRSPSDYICFLIAASTGMRSGEVLALRWCNVHVADRYIHICEAWKDNNHTVSGLPKSYKPRDVIIPQYLADRLVEYQRITAFGAPGDLVVCTDDGRPYTIVRWQKVFKRALYGIGITEEDRVARHLKPHSFRHTLNTLMREKGVNPDVIRLMLGWSDAKIQNNYTHFDVARMVRQGELMDAVFTDQQALPVSE